LQLRLPKSPEAMFETYWRFGTETGVTIDPISPTDVTKDVNGHIHIHMTGTYHSKPIFLDYFTDMSDCRMYVADHGITANLANSNDIN
jgi:hypothetical protein